MAMRVLHVVESLLPDAGSVAISLGGLFRALSERDIESRAITADGSAASLPGIAAAKFDSANVDGVVSDVELVHIHGWGGRFPRAMAAAARKAGKPYVISPMGGLCEGPHNRKTWRDKLRGLFSENSLVHSAGAVTAMNECEQQALQSHNLNPNIPLLPCGLDFDEYASRSEPVPDLPPAPDGRCVLLLGPIHPMEGLVPLLKGFAELASDADAWNIVVAGRETGDWRKMLEAAVRRKGGIDRVHFTPAADIATQRAWLARATVFAAPSLHIRCPVSIMQAVAAGVPVVASKLAAPDGLNSAMRVCGPSRAELKEALRSAFTLSDEERTAETQRSRDIARSVYDWPVLAGEYVQLYKGLIHN